MGRAITDCRNAATAAESPRRCIANKDVVMGDRLTPGWEMAMFDIFFDVSWPFLFSPCGGLRRKQGKSQVIPSATMWLCRSRTFVQCKLPMTMWLQRGDQSVFVRDKFCSCCKFEGAVGPRCLSDTRGRWTCVMVETRRCVCRERTGQGEVAIKRQPL